jgi:hypothetical protein
MKGRFPSFWLLTLAALALMVDQPTTAPSNRHNTLRSLSNWTAWTITAQDAHGFESELEA